MGQNSRERDADDHRPHDQPAYSVAEAARYLKLPQATLRSWFLGRPYPTAKGVSHFAPVLRLASNDPATLSFSNLVEAHVLRALRTEHGVSLGAVRKALAYAEHELKISQLLRRSELSTAAGELFLVADSKSILIDPRISFGRPVVDKAFVSTRSILDRIDAGETVEDVAHDYELTKEAVEEAVVFERAA